LRSLPGAGAGERDRELLVMGDARREPEEPLSFGSSMVGTPVVNKEDSRLDMMLVAGLDALG